jgi:hypothetical protein
MTSACSGNSGQTVPKHTFNKSKFFSCLSRQALTNWASGSLYLALGGAHMFPVTIINEFTGIDGSKKSGCQPLSGTKYHSHVVEQ